MRILIQNKLRNALLESMQDEDIGTMKINIPFDKLVLDAENTKIAIKNIKDNRPSRSKDKPMQIAVGSNGDYYLLDGYHRFIEAVSNGKNQTVGIGLNKSYEELKKLNKIGVACAGGSGDEYCNNFKTTTTFENVKNSFKETELNEDETDICDVASPRTEEELIKLLNSTDQITPEQEKEVRQELKGLKQSNDYLSNDMDNTSSIAHKISTTLCSKQNPKNLD